MNPRFLVVGAAIVGLGSSLARAEPTPPPTPSPAAIRVGVVPGIAVNLDAAKVDALDQDLAEALSTALVVDAIGGLEVRRALPPDGVAADCFTVPACVADVARRLNVQQLLFVVMVDTGGTVQIDTTWVDPATGHTASRPAMDLEANGDARARFAALAHGLLPDAALRPKPATGGGGGGLNTQLRSSDGEPRHITTPVIVTAALTVAGVGVAVGFGLDTRSHYNSCERTVCNQSQRDSIRHTGVVGDLGLVAGLGAAIATSILYATSSEAPHLIVAPMASGVAVTTGWRF